MAMGEINRAADAGFAPRGRAEDGAAYRSCLGRFGGLIWPRTAHNGAKFDVDVQRFDSACIAIGGSRLCVVNDRLSFRHKGLRGLSHLRRFASLRRKSGKASRMSSAG